MPPVFGRFHRYDHALDEMHANGGPMQKALATNMRWDRRLKKKREKQFDRLMLKPRSAADLAQAITSYFARYVNTLIGPAFWWSENSRNVVYDGTPNPKHLPGGTEVGTILDITGLLPVIKTAGTMGLVRPSDLPGFNRAWDEAKWNNFLEPLIGGASHAVWVGRILRILNAYRLRRPYQPIWCATWKTLEPIIEHEPPARWLEVLGVDKSTYPRWLVVLKYEVRHAQTLVRPTQLESPWERGCYHFPSPPNLIVTEGGRTMDLGDPARPARVTLPEYVHKQIDVEPAWYHKNGQAVRSTPTFPVGTLRDIHRNLLKMSCFADDAWMPDPI